MKAYLVAILRQEDKKVVKQGRSICFRPLNSYELIRKQVKGRDFWNKSFSPYEGFPLHCQVREVQLFITNLFKNEVLKNEGWSISGKMRFLFLLEFRSLIISGLIFRCQEIRSILIEETMHSLLLLSFYLYIFLW